MDSGGLASAESGRLSSAHIDAKPVYLSLASPWVEAHDAQRIIVVDRRVADAVAVPPGVYEVPLIAIWWRRWNLGGGG